MALRFPARVKARTSTTGTGPFTVDESVISAGYRSFTQAVTDNDLANGDTIPILIIDTTVTNGPKLFQISTATWNNTTKTLSIVTTYQPGGTPPSWGAGTRDVLVISNPVLWLLLAGGTMSGVLNILIGGTLITPAAETSLIVQRSTVVGSEVGLSLISGTSGKSKLNMGDTADEDALAIIGDNANNSITFRTNGVDRQVIDSAGVLKTAAAGNSYDAFAGGNIIKWPFYVASAPTGWIKDTTNNDKALRVVSGTGGGSGGGGRGLSAASVADHTLTIFEMPAHAHGPGSPTTAFIGVDNVTGSGNLGMGTNVGIASETALNGSSDPHTHALALDYIDVIVCSKN